VDHSVAVGAHRAQILYRGDLVSAPDLGQRLEMVDVDKALADFAVSLREVEAAYAAGVAVVVDTALGRLTATLVGVHGDPFGCTFDECSYTEDFLWRLEVQILCPLLL
jgi:hypothetical protein